MSPQFVNRNNKKPTPSKPDLLPAAEKNLRRSGRRRNVRCTFDFGDYLDDDEYSFVEEEEDERRRQKKIELLLKLHSSTTNGDSPSSSSDSDDDDDDDDKPSKKRKLINCEIDYGENEENEYDEIEEDEEVKGVKREEGTNEVDYALGTPTKPPSECPLPDKKILELILQKLQKKDIYGVYAEPVDPEELPDYHDLIENPMDFSTIKSKLSNGSYATLEQLESDIFLLCSNAMQYNEPDTIYHKQARAIQDLAKRKLEKLRIDNKLVENQMKSEPKQKPVSVFKKQIQRQLSRTQQEPIGSDFSNDPTSEIVDHTRNASNVMQAGVIEKTSSLDVLVGRNNFVIDTSVDKLGESLAGRSAPPRFGRTSPTQEEDRITYSIGGQPNASSDSAFSPFDGETKQLIPVGLYVEHAYARSLARFAGTLGHVAWRVASKRIKQILNPGSEFGRGWVVEYDPLPTPVLIPDNCNIGSDFFAKPQHTDNASKHEVFTNPAASVDGCISGPPLEGKLVKLPFPNPSLLEVTTSSSGNSFREEPYVKESTLEGKSSFSCSNRTTISGSSISRPLPTSQLSSLVDSSKKVVKPVDPIGPFSHNHNSDQLAMGRWVCNNAEAPMPKSAEMVSVNRSSLPSASFKQSNISGVTFRPLQTDKPLLNERAINYAAGGSNGTPSCSEMNKVGPYSYEQLADPVQLMKMLTENKNQQNPASQSAFSCPPIPSVAQSLNREDSSIAAGVARSWMAMGSGGLRPTVDKCLQKNQILAEPLYNATLAQQSQFSRFRGDFPAPLVYFQPGKNNYPFQGALPQQVRVGSAVQLQNQPMVVPQLSPSDLSQAQYPWRNVSPHTQQAHKQGTTCPPDLNVSFQSSGSPGRPSPGVVVDSRHPDLVLQL